MQGEHERRRAAAVRAAETRRSNAARKKTDDKRIAREQRELAYRRSLASRRGRSRAYQTDWRDHQQRISAMVGTAKSDPRYVAGGLTIHDDPRYTIAELEAEVARLRFEHDTLALIARALRMPPAERRARARALRQEIADAERKIEIWSRPYLQRRFDDFLEKPFDSDGLREWRWITLMEFKNRYSPEWKRERKRVRRKQERETAEGKVDRQAIFERDHGACQLCGNPVQPDDFTLDHIIPIAAGGSHTEANLRLAHRGCNSRRGIAGWTRIGLERQ